MRRYRTVLDGGLNLHTHPDALGLTLKEKQKHKSEKEIESEVKKKKRCHFRNYAFLFSSGDIRHVGNVRPSADGYESDELNLLTNKSSASASFNLLFALYRFLF
jgi:hypothetical protein